MWMSCITVGGTPRCMPGVCDPCPQTSDTDNPRGVGRSQAAAGGTSPISSRCPPWHGAKHIAENKSNVTEMWNEPYQSTNVKLDET